MFSKLDAMLARYDALSEQLSSQETMSDMEKKLSPHHFVRCNSYYLVNLKYVDSLRGDTLLVAGNELRISQSRRQAFLTELARYAGGSV